MIKQFIIFRYCIDNQLISKEVKLVTENTINDHLSNKYFVSLFKWDELIENGEVTLTSKNNKIVLTCF